MKVWFESIDGKMFDTQEECKAHEEAISSFKMFNQRRVAKNTDEALVVYFSKTGSAEAFIAKCMDEGSDYEGIYCGNTGLYVWDDGNDRYSYVSERVLEAVETFLKNR